MSHLDDSRASPVWWEAWDQIINPLLRAATFSSPEPEFLTTLRALARQGCPVAGILNWRPNPEEAERLRWVGYEMRFALDPKLSGPEREAHKTALLKQLDGSDQHWKNLTTLAQIYVSSFWKHRDRRQITWGSPGARMPGRRLTAEVGEDVSRTQEVAYGSLGAYPLHTLYSIYIDESFGANDGKEEPVIAGVVWAGDEVDEAELPSIPSHLWTIDDPHYTLCKRALNRLLESPKSFPIVIKFQKSHPKRNRKDLVQSFLKTLLGWALPRNASVEIFIEQHGKDQAGQTPTEYYKGIFNSAAWCSSRRYQLWKLKKVHTVAKGAEGYVGYADLLAYVGAMPATELAEWFRCERLPGYFSIPFEIVRLLERIDEADSARDPEAILDCFQALFGTGLEEVVLPGICRALAEPEAQHRLLCALEERYKAKDKNLSGLDRQLRAIKKYLFPADLPETATFKMRLVWTVLELQDANHGGDTARGRQAARKYLSIREEAFVRDSRMVAHVDCNLSVHYCDQLDLFAAERVLLTLRQDPAFINYDPLQKAVIESCLGQVSSMQGYRKADWHFGNALAFLAKADLTDKERRGEWTQIETYRAMNAIDEDSPLVGELICNVLGSDLSAAALCFASSADQPFQHHLFLRYVYFCDWTTRNAAITAYFESFASSVHPVCGGEFPWELIELYRALLQFQRHEDDRSRAHFFRAINLVPRGSGIATLSKAMISVIANCCFANRAFEDAAKDSINRAEMELEGPESARVVKLFRDVCAAPTPLRVNEALTALPFNYH